MTEKYVWLLYDRYQGSKTMVRCARCNRWVQGVVVLCQGSTLIAFLFELLMDRLTDEVRQEFPWTMMFADDIVIFSQSRKQVEQRARRDGGMLWRGKE